MTTQEAQTIINNVKNKEDPRYKEAKAFLENQQSTTNNTKNSLKGANETKTPKKSGLKQVFSDIGTAMRNNQMGAGGASMSNAQPIIQQKIEDQKIIDETAEATGLERNKGLLKGNATDSKDVAQNLKDRGVAVTDEYKAKHSDVFNDFKVGKESKVEEENKGGASGNGGSGSGNGNGSKKSALDAKTQNFMDKQNAIANTQEDTEYERQKEELFKRWDARNENMDKMKESMKNIDDHYLDQLPTFMFRRYQNGEFGDPKGKDAKLRLAYFMLNGLQSKMKQASNLFNNAAGRGAMFDDTTSDYEKLQNSNLQQGLENRWSKYKQETQAAMDLAKQGGMSEEELTDSIAKISSNNRLQSTFNQMNERQKVYALQVLNELGDKLGNMNDEDFANTLMAMSYSGDSLDYKEAAGMLIYRFVKDPEKRDKLLSDMGFGEGGSLLGKLVKGN